MKSRSIKAFTLFELLISIAIIAILASFIGGLAGGCGTRSSGSRVGIVTKFSLKGFVTDSYEGELMMGNGNATAVWAFSVDKSDADMVKKVEDAMRSGKRVEVKYRQARVKGFTQDTSYTVTDVQRTE